MANIAVVPLTEQLINAMARSTGDYSSLHMNSEFARRTRYRQRIVHGMLPIALAYMLYTNGRANRLQLCLEKLVCRFTGALCINDEIMFSFSDGSSEDQILFEIRNVRDQSVATSGQFFFRVSERVAQESDAPTLFQQPLAEQVLMPTEVLAGREESLTFTATRACMQAWIALLPESLQDRFGSGDADENFNAALAVSTLIGMRLPGRFATFMDLTTQFDADITHGDSVSLRATVASAPSATNRTRLALSWICNGIEIGRGQANTLVNPVNTSSPSSAALRQTMSLGIEGKVALVTGSSRGIGEVTARLLAMHGAKTVVHYYNGQTDALAVVDDIHKNGGSAIAVQGDLRKADDIARMFKEIHAAFGGVDILVNNAVSKFAPNNLLAVSANDYLEELNVSLFGMHECCRLALPHMQEQQWGKIVNLGTIATEEPVSGQSVYIAVKSAVGGYTRSLATEFAQHNIQANMVVPRMTDTSLIASLPRSLVDKLAEESVAGRLLEPLEVAKVIAFLASDWSNPISGQRIVLNQGEIPFL